MIKIGMRRMMGMREEVADGEGNGGDREEIDGEGKGGDAGGNGG